MRKIALFVWLLVPIAVGAYHYGPGQDRLRVDRAAEAIERAQAFARDARATAAKDGDDAARAAWTDAEEAFGEAIDLLPPNRAVEGRALRLERANAQVFVGRLPDARHDLEVLVDEIAGDPKGDPQLLREARGALANAQYYMTWLMRLEGAARTEWEPEIEASRQNYKLVAEDRAHAGDVEVAKSAREDLESAIRLERMELPSQ